MAFRQDRRTFTFCLMLSAGATLVGCGGSDQPGAPAPAPAPIIKKTCAELTGMTIPAASIGLPTGGASVTSSEAIAASGSGASALVAYCKVLGEINPVDPQAPKIKFQVSLPVTWNDKALMFGGGGYDGVLPAGTQNVPAGPTDKPVPLSRGYATFSSDSGHQANASTVRDGSFGGNDEALANFSGNALKKTRDTAIAIITAHYGAAPRKTYFAGGSSGGREGLVAVSNWPQDFDGLIAMYPAWNAVALNLQFGRITRELAKPGAYANPQKRKLLYDASMAACDTLDGAQDGLISNVDACNAQFDPATAVLNGVALRCAGGADLGDACLSDAQINGFKVISTPLQLDYTLASGETSYPGFNTWGTNFGMTGSSPLQATILTLGLGMVQPASPMPAVGALSPPFHSTFWDQWIKYFVTRDANADSLAFDPYHPGPYQARVVQLNGMQDANKLDLTAFQARGGKIVMAHGTADQLVSTQATRQYLNRLYNAMGKDNVNSFVRYYEIPGYAHVVSTAFNASWDSLTALEGWTERNEAPAGLVVTDTFGVAGRTRPLCEFPAWPKYKGSGDLNVAANFSCATQ